MSDHAGQPWQFNRTEFVFGAAAPSMSLIAPGLGSDTAMKRVSQHVELHGQAGKVLWIRQFRALRRSHFPIEPTSSTKELCSFADKQLEAHDEPAPAPPSALAPRQASAQLET